MEITCRVYRPRRARDTPLFRLVEQHLEDLLRLWPQRFARTHGPLRPVVERVLRGFLTCGLVERGFARAWCNTCRTSYLIPYSCRGRNFCPSCEKKRSLLWAEWVREEVLEPVPHPHAVLTMPRLLRGIFRKRLVYLDGQQAVIYKALKHNPTLGRNFETMDPLEWLARMSDHIPDPGRHRTRFYAYYAHRVRGDRTAPEPAQPEVEEKPAKKRRCSASWARLISKVFHVDPLTCAC